MTPLTEGGLLGNQPHGAEHLPSSGRNLPWLQSPPSMIASPRRDRVGRWQAELGHRVFSSVTSTRTWVGSASARHSELGTRAGLRVGKPVVAMPAPVPAARAAKPRRWSLTPRPPTPRRSAPTASPAPSLVTPDTSLTTGRSVCGAFGGISHRHLGPIFSNSARNRSRPQLASTRRSRRCAPRRAAGCAGRRPR
jgi:hypothetical protein